MSQNNLFFRLQHFVAGILRRRDVAVILILALLIAFFVCYYLFSLTPSNFPVQTVVSVNKGVTVDEVSSFFKENRLVNSGRIMSIFIRIFSGGRGAIAGEYYFPQKESLFSVSYRVARGIYGINTIKVTIPEGISVKEMAQIMDRTLPQFDSIAFLAAAKGKEGYLFPDTYNLTPITKPADIVAMMENNFSGRIKSIESEIEEFGKPLKDIITMASLLEGEARQTETRRIVAGILWKRLKNKMPLQVDTAFKYINGKNSSNLTLDDLQKDSPYNTYTRIGLPPTPISNPGLDSILAAVTPIESKYFYFLTDKNGVMHYAVTFEEHVANKNRYLP